MTSDVFIVKRGNLFLCQIISEFHFSTMIVKIVKQISGYLDFLNYKFYYLDSSNLFGNYKRNIYLEVRIIFK